MSLDRCVIFVLDHFVPLTLAASAFFLMGVVQIGRTRRNRKAEASGETGGQELARFPSLTHACEGRHSLDAASEAWWLQPAGLEADQISGDETDEELGVLPAALPGSGQPLPNCPELAAWHHVTPELRQATRNILIGFLLSSADGKLPRVVSFTSPGGGNGKTTVATNLAILLAGNRRNVLLIDAGLGEHRLSQLFHLTPEPGLDSLLRSSRPLEDWQVERAIRSTGIPSLSVLPRETGEPKTDSAQASSRLAEMLLLCRRRFDLVLIDGPALDSGSDSARLLAVMSDGAAIVAPAAADSHLQEKAVMTLATDGAHVLGTIRNERDTAAEPGSWPARVSRTASSRPAIWAAVLALALTGFFSLFQSTASYSRLRQTLGAASGTTLPAHVRPGRSIQIAAAAAGILRGLEILPGAQVTAGQILARIESPGAKEELQRAEARLQLARERLSLFAQPGGGPSEIRASQQRQRVLANLTAARERLANFSLAEVEQAYENARAHARRIRELVSSGLATSAELDDSLRQQSVELRNLQAAREHLSRLQQEVRSAELDARNAESGGGSGSLDEMSARMEFEEATEQVRRAKRLIEDLVIKAEVNGTITAVSHENGEEVQAGEALFQLADLSTLVFEVPVAAETAQSIHQGDPVTVRLPTVPPQRIDAAVTTVTLAPDSAEQAYLVQIRLRNPAPDVILAGLKGAVEFRHGEFSWSQSLSY